MSSPFVADLRASMDLNCQIDILTVDGQHHETMVADIDEEAGWVRIHNPQHFGDDTTTTTMLIADVAQATLHPDIAY